MHGTSHQVKLTVAFHAEGVVTTYFFEGDCCQILRCKDKCGGVGCKSTSINGQ